MAEQDSEGTGSRGTGECVVRSAAMLPNGHGIELRTGHRPWLECLVSVPKGYQISIGVSSRTSVPMPC